MNIPQRAFAISLAFHCILAVLFILITFSTKQEENSFVNVQFVEYREEQPAPEVHEQEGPSSAEQPSQRTPPPHPEIPAPTKFPVLEKQPDEQVVKEQGIDANLPSVSKDEESGSIKTQSPLGTILRKNGLPKKFPALSDHPDTIAVVRGEHVSFDQYLGTLNQKKPKSPTGPEDERRRYSNKIFGVKMDSFLGVIPAVRHIGKSLVWKVQDIRNKRKIIKARERRYTDLDEKSICFLILLWRDDLIDPDRLSRSDRLIITQNTENDASVQSNRSYLEGMSHQGLVTSLMKSGRIHYRAIMTRDEVLKAFEERLKNAEDENEKEKLREYIELVNRCYNPIVNRLVVPEYQ